MIWSNIPLLLATGLPSEIISSLENMPVMPGKIIFYSLAILSTIGWSVIIAKSFLIRRLNQADRSFKQRLIRSRTVLEPYQHDESYRPSLLFDVYDEGARAAATEMFGSADRQLVTAQNLSTHGYMTRSQLNLVDDALEHGEKIGATRLREGISLLRIISIVAPILGITGACWIMISALSADGAVFRSLLSCALIIVAASLFVSAPAGLGRIYYLNKIRRFALKTRRFRTQMLRVFGDAFEVVEPGPQPETVTFEPTPVQEAPLPLEPVQPEPPIEEERPVVYSAPPQHQPAAIAPTVSPAPFHSPFSIDDDMTDYESMAQPQIPEVDLREALVPDFNEELREQQPPPPRNTDHPYVSPNY